MNSNLQKCIHKIVYRVVKDFEKGYTKFFSFYITIIIEMISENYVQRNSMKQWSCFIRYMNGKKKENCNLGVRIWEVLAN